MKHSKWKNIMASSNLISFQKQRRKSARDIELKQNTGKSFNQLNQYLNETNNGNDMIIESTCDPEFIIWNNLGKTRKDRIYKKSKSFVVLLSIIILSYVIIHVFKLYRHKKFG